MGDAGRKIIEGLEEAVAGNLAAVTIDGQRWVRDEDWQPIEAAPKDGTRILAKFFDDIYPARRPARPDLEPWNGCYVVLRHPGILPDGFDLGWNIAAPVGHGGFPDQWIAGWRPLPSPPEPGAR